MMHQLHDTSASPGLNVLKNIVSLSAVEYSCHGDMLTWNGYFAVVHGFWEETGLVSFIYVISLPNLFYDRMNTS